MSEISPSKLSPLHKGTLTLFSSLNLLTHEATKHVTKTSSSSCVWDLKPKSTNDQNEVNRICSFLVTFFGPICFAALSGTVSKCWQGVELAERVGRISLCFVGNCCFYPRAPKRFVWLSVTLSSPNLQTNTKTSVIQHADVNIFPYLLHIFYIRKCNVTGMAEAHFVSLQDPILPLFFSRGNHYLEA